MAYADYVQDNDHYVLEYRVRHKSGHYVWVLDSGRVFRDASGKVIRIAGATVDISARKKVEVIVRGRCRALVRQILQIRPSRVDRRECLMLPTPQ